MSLRADELDFLGDDRLVRGREGSFVGPFGLWVAGSTLVHAIAGTEREAGIMNGHRAPGARRPNRGVGALLYRYGVGESQAVSNGCLINITVMIAGAGVWAFATRWPDVVVAAIIEGLSPSSKHRAIRHTARERCEPAALVAAMREGGIKALAISSPQSW
jgi:hypothetical protein